MPTGVDLNRYPGSGSCIPWHSDNESMFGPQHLSKLIVSMSSGPGEVPSSITLDHGDLLPGHGWFSAIGVCTSHGA